MGLMQQQKRKDVAVMEINIAKTLLKYFKILNLYGFFPKGATAKMVLLPYIEQLMQEDIYSTLTEEQQTKVTALYNCLKKHCLV